MHTSSPAIVVEEFATRPHKRRRVGGPETDCPRVQGVVSHSDEPETTTAHSANTIGSVDANGAISEDTIVCFGMILDRPVTAHLDAAPDPASRIETVRFTPTRAICRCKDNIVIGKVDKNTGAFLSSLAADDEIRVQLALFASPVVAEPSAKLSKKATHFLGIIIYGPKNRLEDVGEFVSESSYYLDDPFGCDENVPYINPQCLFSLHEGPTMTFDLPQLRQQDITEFTSSSSDILAGFETTDNFQEASDPPALCTALQTHQRQALTFFLRREQGLHPTEDGIGIWSRRSSKMENLFVNSITNEECSTQVPIWRGGLLADEMGLGKTLSMIALIASDSEVGTAPSLGKNSHVKELPTTLVVVPLSLLSEWEKQLKQHVHRGKLTWFHHHGRNRFQLRHGTRPPNIILTTYQVVEREKRGDKPRENSLFHYHWKRIILDEAHIIRNHGTSTARATAALYATSRWAISGTPIHNGLTDFLGLFKFLHFVPYDNAKIFDNDISNLWRTRPAEEAVEIFKKFLSCVMIRRTKTILNLPSREDRIMRLPFDREEREHYRQIERPTIDMLDQTPEERSGPAPSWMTAIQQINKLRLVCNLGTFVPAQQAPLLQSSGDDLSAVLAARFSAAGELCVHCLQSTESLPNENELGSSSPRVYYSTCHQFFCAGCADLLKYQTTQPCECVERSPSCTLSLLKALPHTPRLSPTGDSPGSRMDTGDSSKISSKVEALVCQIKNHLSEKHVVFSSWTSSLDMVERGLQTHGISWVRVDGSVTAKNRGRVLGEFHSDPSIGVILVTVSCGACGLDLTAATYVHLLEPQWNPSVEDQALARAHRLGQTRPVTTIRYVMENSFEEQVLKVQDRKKLLATALLSKSSSLESLRGMLGAA